MGISESSQFVFPVDGVMQKTWDDAVARWLLEKADKASLKSDECIFRWLEPYLCGLQLSKIGRVLIDEIVLFKRKSSASNGTVNRMLALLRSVLRRAFLEWEWIESVPRIRMLREPKRRVRFLTLKEAQELLSHLPEAVALMATFSLATGLRKSNVTGLQWSQIDMGRCMAWVHPDQSKTRKAIGVPLNVDAMRVLQLCKERHPVSVFFVERRKSGED